MDHGDIDPGLTTLGVGLVVFAQAPVLTKPGERALHYPAVGQYLEALELIRESDDLKHAAYALSYPTDEGAGVAAVSPDAPKAHESVRQSTKQHPSRQDILDVSSKDDQADDEAHGVDKEVTLSALYFLPGVVTPDPPFSVVFTDWLSRMAAEGAGSLPASTRTCWCKCSCRRASVPFLLQRS